MRFFSKHGPATMHNAVGALLTLGLLATGGVIFSAIKAARAWVIPVWFVFGVLLMAFVPLLWCLYSSRRKLISAKSQLDRIQTERNQWKRKFEELEALLSLVPKVEFHFDAYWTRREDGFLDGPFSAPVWDTERKLIKMHYEQSVDYKDGPRLRFICLKFGNKDSLVPIEFMKQNRVWPEEELGGLSRASDTEVKPLRGLPLS